LVTKDVVANWYANPIFGFVLLRTNILR